MKFENLKGCRELGISSTFKIEFDYPLARKNNLKDLKELVKIVDGRIVYKNKAKVVISNFPKHQLIEKSFNEVIHQLKSHLRSQELENFNKSFSIEND